MLNKLSFRLRAGLSLRSSSSRSRYLCRRQAQRVDAVTTPPREPDVSSPNCEAQDPPTPEEQAVIAETAVKVLGAAEARLREKLAEYDEQLKELEEYAANNFFYRWLNQWTMNLLYRKKAFVTERIQTMQELATSVNSCTLDCRCTFKLNTTADLEEVRRAVDASLDQLLLSSQLGNLESISAQVRTSLDKSGAIVKQQTLSMPEMTWSVDAEARDLEDALWKAASVAAGIEGARVQVARRYRSVQKTENVLDDGVAEFASTVMTDKFTRAMGLGTSSRNEFVEVLGPGRNLPFDAACQAIISTIVSTWIAGFVVWAFGLTPDLSKVLHWNMFLPTTAAHATTLTLWTLPLVGAYGALGLVRRLKAYSPPSSTPSTLTRAACIAADRLQRGGRTLRYMPTSTQSDMRVLYFLSTVQFVGERSPWLYCVLPGFLMKCGAPIQGVFFGIVPSFMAMPFVVLTSAALVGAMDLGNSAMDAMRRDARRDETKYVDSLFQINDGGMDKVSVDKGNITFSETLGATAQSVKTELGRRGFPSALSQQAVSAPASITLDFRCAAAQLSNVKLADWIGPTAIFFSMCYLSTEAVVTQEIAYCAFTQLAAISVLDALSTPWVHPNINIQVRVKPPVKKPQQ